MQIWHPGRYAGMGMPCSRCVIKGARRLEGRSSSLCSNVFLVAAGRRHTWQHVLLLWLF